MRRVVIKVGSAVLTQDNKIANERILKMVEFISELKKRYDVVLVSSGAVAAGYDVLKVDKSIAANKRALASAGQPILMAGYKHKFDHFGIDTAQILLVEADFASKRRSTLLEEIVDVHLSNGLIPIINENDVTSRVEELFGDNDQLSAQVAHVIGADLLVILSDVEGFYDKNPHEHDDAVLRSVVNEISKDELIDKATPNDLFATGGIVTKLKAASFMMQHGRKMFLCNGFELSAVKSFLLDDIQTEGTLFFAH